MVGSCLHKDRSHGAVLWWSLRPLTMGLSKQAHLASTVGPCQGAESLAEFSLQSSLTPPVEADICHLDGCFQVAMFMGLNIKILLSALFQSAPFRAALKAALAWSSDQAQWIRSEAVMCWHLMFSRGQNFSDPLFISSSLRFRLSRESVWCSG